MSTALFNELSSYFNMDDPAFQKELIRPAEIKEDFKLMEQRQRVTKIMKSKLFKRELENIVKLHGAEDDYDGAPTSTLSLAEISEQLLLAAIPKNKVNNFTQLNNRKGLICINDLHKDAASMYGRLESQFRCKLASVFRLIDMYGWNNGFNTTMTTRPFKDREQFLINPFGLMFHEVTASSFLSLDFKGNILDFGSTVLEAHNSAWMIHAALYSFRTDIRAILQLKTPAAVAVSSLYQGLLPICREAIVIGDTICLNELAVLEQETKSTSLILADIKNYLTSMLDLTTKIIIIPNQGFLICGESIEEAWHYLTNCQIACETQLKLGNLDNEDIIIPKKEVQSELFYQWRLTDLGGIFESEIDNKKDSKYKWRLGELEFEALMRHLDNNGYRTGYLYRQESIYTTSNIPSNSNQEIEIPASSRRQTRSQYDDDDPGMISDPETRDTIRDYRMRQSLGGTKSDKWFHTPNSYKAISTGTGNQDDGGSILLNSSHLATGPVNTGQSTTSGTGSGTRWVSSKKTVISSKPQHPITAGACVPFDEESSIKNQASHSLHTSPRHAATISTKEIIENQRRLRNKYYQDKNTAGPISCLLDSGLSREEALRMKTESLRKQMNQPSSGAGDVVTSASKGIIQRGHQAVVYQELYKPANPFENVTSEDIENYKQEIDRKLHPYKYASVDDNLHKTYDERDDSVGIATDGDIDVDRRRPITVGGLQSEPELGSPTRPISHGLTSDSDAISTEMLESKTSKLAAPVQTGAMTSETSGAEVSHDEVEHDGKPKKRKHKFKFPFSKKKKDKSKPVQ